MKHLVLHAIIFLNISILIHCKQEHDLLLLQPPTLQFYNNIPIKIHSHKFLDCLTNIQNKLSNTWKSICNDIEKEMNVTQKNINNLLNDPHIAKKYMLFQIDSYYKNITYIDESLIDQEIKDFLITFFQKYCPNKKILIFFSAEIDTLTRTFGTDLNGHYIICNCQTYSPKNFQYLLNQSDAFYIEPLNTQTQKIRSVELKTMLLLGLLDAASHINHQSSFFNFIISNLIKQQTQERLSAKTIFKCWQFTELRSYFETILQTNNPLETICFMFLEQDDFIIQKPILKKFALDIKSCYQTESIKEYKRIKQYLKDLYFDNNSLK